MVRTNGTDQNWIVDEVKNADLDDKMMIMQEAMEEAHRHGNAEELLRNVVRNAAPNVKQAAATEAVSSDKEAASYILGEATKQAPHEARMNAVREAVERTHTQRDARELILQAMSVAPEASKDAVSRAVKNADTAQEAQELITEVINAAPASTAKAAVNAAKISPETLDQIWLTIVKTFAWVLGGATAGLVVVILLDIFYSVELAHVQIMLTMFTTVAGILAGFITGQAVGTAQERGREKG